MFAIAFDLAVVETAKHFPRGISKAYAQIGAALADYGFTWVQGSVYLTDRDDLANLFAAILAVKALPWFPASARHLRAFKVEHWSDFTPLMKS